MMSGESLMLATKHWIPSSEFEFCVTSSDILFAKPSKNIFVSALKYADVSPSECWYCGDGIIPDVYGSSGIGMSPVLLDVNSETPLEFRIDNNCSKYMAVNNWNELSSYISNI
jgi:FMN phosphatase YigB (HAD superfamily)